MVAATIPQPIGGFPFGAFLHAPGFLDFFVPLRIDSPLQIVRLHQKGYYLNSLRGFWRAIPEGRID